jgi:3-oxoacyl-[acyl-carrier-protein] synthase II
MTVSVRGIGWLTKSGFGCIGSRVQHLFTPGEDGCSLAKRDIFGHPFKNFGRLDRISQLTACAVALALRDAAIDYAPTVKQDIGIIGTGSEGSLSSDIAYFTDYLDNGRTLARGNLFIYTLPSSPLGEAAIHFGLVGPLLYATRRDQPLSAVMTTAAEMVAGGETGRMLAGFATEDEALYVVLDREQGDGSLCNLSKAREIVAAAQDVAGMAVGFSLVKNKEGIV